MHRRQRLTAVLAAGPLVLAGACSSSVEVTPAADSGSPGCAQVGGAWPATVGGHASVATSSDSPSVHAWGDPAIIARCGVPALGPTSNECVAVDDVDWVAEPLSDGTRFTTYGRAPAIEVLVPKAYDPGALLLPALSKAAHTLPTNGRHCT